MTIPRRRSRLGRASVSMVSMGGGIALAAVPPATLSISSHTFSTGAQGYISVATTAATFIAQLVAAAVVEARLGSPGIVHRVATPWWLSALGVIGAVVTAVLIRNPVALCVALPFLVSALEVGRSVSVAERLDGREIIAAAILGAGTLGGLAVAFTGGSWGVVPLMAGIAGTIVVRAVGAPRMTTHPSPGVRFWVVTDVGITGVIYPLLNALVLTFLGPAGAVLFAAVSSVSGLLAIPLNFMRLRLLKAHSRLDILVSAGAVLLCAVVIVVLELTGVFGLVFAGHWTLAATLVPLVVACVWRAASLASTLPFAALRRAGHVRVLTVLRACCAGATFAVGLAVLPLQNLALVFAVLLMGELGQAVVYEVARRRRTAASR